MQRNIVPPHTHTTIGAAIALYSLLSLGAEAPTATAVQVWTRFIDKHVHLPVPVVTACFARHGVQNQQGRQVLLDDDDKVMYSTPDVSMYRTGISSGVGFPELCLDSQHADVLVSCVKAAMRKVKKTSQYRNKVAASFLRIKSFCDVMLASATSPLGAGSSDMDDVMGLETQPEDR